LVEEVVGLLDEGEIEGIENGGEAFGVLIT
jgi:hypothetical protein